jgi:hypothetical protein
MKERGDRVLRLDDLSVLGCFLLVAYILIAIAWCRRYDPRQLLWFCDIAVLLTALGLLFRSRMLIMAQLTAIVFYHAVWNIDFWSILVFSKSPIGSASYMFYADLGLVEKSLSLFTHVFIIPVALFGVYILDAPQRAWLIQWAQTFLILLLTYFLTFPEENINRVFGLEIIGISPASINPIFYYALMIMLPPFMIYLPTNKVIAMTVSRIHQKKRDRLESKPADAKEAGLSLASSSSLRLHPLSATVLMLLAAAFSTTISYKAHNKYVLAPTIFQISQDNRTLLEDMPPPRISTTIEQILYGDREALRQAQLLVWPHAALPKQWSDLEGKVRPHTKSMLLEVKVDDIPSVPQEVWLRGTRSAPESVVWAYVVSDDFYAQTNCDLPAGKKSFEVLCRIGGRGISEYVDPSTGEMYASTPYNEIIGKGIGAIYALGVIEMLEGEVIARSPLYLVKRKGIFYPEDMWFAFRDNTLIPLISNPADALSSRIAFQRQSGQANNRVEIYTCDFFAYKMHNLSHNHSSSYQLFSRDGESADDIGWVSNNMLQCYTEEDGKLMLIQIADSN